MDVPAIGHVDKLAGTIKSMTADAAKVLYDPSYSTPHRRGGSVQKYNPATGQMKQFPCKFTMRATPATDKS